MYKYMPSVSKANCYFVFLSSSAQQLSDLTEDMVRFFPMERIRQHSVLLAPGRQCRICLRPYQVCRILRLLVKITCINWCLHFCIDVLLSHKNVFLVRAQSRRTFVSYLFAYLADRFVDTVYYMNVLGFTLYLFLSP